MYRSYLLILFIAALTTSCFSGENSDAETGEVNIYTHRHYEVDRQIFEKFEEETGIKVNLVKAGADELIVRLENEGEQSPADLLFTVDAGRLTMAKDKGLFQPIESETLNAAIPAHLRDPEGHWFAQTMRARILAYSKDRVNPDELSTYEALTDPEWNGRILVRTSANIYNQSLLASIIAHHGEEAAEEWARGMVNNFAREPKGNDTDQIIAVAAGIGDVALVNSYYIGKLLQSEDAGQKAAADQIEVFFPNQDGRGTHVNISGAGVTRYAPNKENAIRLLEYMATPEVQSLYAEANAEFPVHREAEQSELLKSWGEWKQDTLSLQKLGANNSAAVETFDRAGWN